MRKIIRTGGLLLCAGVLCCAGAPAASAAAPLTLGFSADPFLTSGSSSTVPWIERAAADGASIVRVNVLWAQVAPQQRPVGFDPSDPADPAYNWSQVDSAVRDLSSHGLQVMLTILDAPSWAEGPHPPAGIAPGSWRPDPQQLADFATAAARRYDGSFLDPANPGNFLPRVQLWQAWNEPNLDFYLSPQWTKAGHHWTMVAPTLYRQMLNDFYAAVKSVSASNRVFMGGTAPYGDPVGSDAFNAQRTQPVAFYRSLFCLQAGSLKPYGCPSATHLDGVDHHPYGIQGPYWHAVNADDAAVPDVYKITRVLKAAVKSGHALPRAHKSVWVTEIGWSSNPPNPRGVPVNKDARWYELAMYVLWKQGVQTVMPLEIRDPDSRSEFVFEGGLYYYNGKPKPILTAYQFPFITHRKSKGKVLAWGRAPQAGKLKIEVSRRGHWAVLRKISVGRHQVFSVPLALRGRASLRAADGSQISLTWSQSG